MRLTIYAQSTIASSSCTRPRTVNAPAVKLSGRLKKVQITTMALPSSDAASAPQSEHLASKEDWDAYNARWFGLWQGGLQPGQVGN
jgi:hypothetical protein